jgi:hypothetical protein
MKLKNLLPADTRPIELISGTSLLISAILIFITQDLYFPEKMNDVHQWPFWGILSLVFGFIQILSVIEDDMEPIRTITAWLTGTYWVWSGFFHLMSDYGHFYDIVLIVLGLSCLYSFIINLQFIKKSWNSQ